MGNYGFDAGDYPLFFVIVYALHSIIKALILGIAVLIINLLDMFGIINRDVIDWESKPTFFMQKDPRLLHPEK